MSAGWVGRLIAGLLLLAVSGGCSVKFIYNNLDRVARMGVGEYLDMTPQQREYFAVEFARVHRWHRQTQLPVYAELLESIPPLLADGAQREELRNLELQMRGWAEAAIEQALPMTLQILRTMTDAQLADLPDRLERSNREIAAPELDRELDAVQAQWAEEVEDAFKRFAGRLTMAQRAYLAAQSVSYIPERELWAEYRRRWQAELLRLLHQRRELSDFDAQFLALARDRESYYGEELAAIFAHNEELYRQVGLWLLNHLTPEQSRRLAERLEDLATDFRELADQAEDDDLAWARRDAGGA